MKLIRDKIPLIMEQANVKYEARHADNDEYKSLLREKLLEEADEFLEDPSIEEAADIYEVFLCLIKNWGFDVRDVTKEADRKRETHGSFNERLVLTSKTNTQPSFGGSRYSRQIFNKPEDS